MSTASRLLCSSFPRRATSFRPKYLTRTTPASTWPVPTPSWPRPGGEDEPLSRGVKYLTWPSTEMYSFDVATRSTKCFTCEGKVEKGEPRMGLPGSNSWGSTEYHHLECLGITRGAVAAIRGGAPDPAHPLRADSIVRIATKERQCCVCEAKIVEGTTFIAFPVKTKSFVPSKPRRIRAAFHVSCLAFDEEALELLSESTGYVHEEATVALDHARARVGDPAEARRSSTMLAEIDAEYDRATKVFADWAALKAQHPFLTSRTIAGESLTSDALVRHLDLQQLKTCVEGATGKRAKSNASKSALAALFLATAGVDGQLVRPTKLTGYDSRLAERK